MAHRWTNTLSAADVTPKQAYLNRRQIMAGLGGMAGLAGLGALPGAARAETYPVTSARYYCNLAEFRSSAASRHCPA